MNVWFSCVRFSFFSTSQEIGWEERLVSKMTCFVSSAMQCLNSKVSSGLFTSATRVATLTHDVTVSTVTSELIDIPVSQAAALVCTKRNLFIKVQ